MDNLIDKIKNYITPTTTTPKASLQNLRRKTKKLERQADYVEAEAELLERADKAKTRISVAGVKKRERTKRLVFILVGLIVLVILILVIAGSC